MVSNLTEREQAVQYVTVQGGVPLYSAADFSGLGAAYVLALSRHGGFRVWAMYVHGGRVEGAQLIHKGADLTTAAACLAYLKHGHRALVSTWYTEDHGHELSAKASHMVDIAGDTLELWERAEGWAKRHK